MELWVVSVLLFCVMLPAESDKFNNNVSQPAYLWPYTALYSWWWVRLSPKTCRVKPLRIKNAIVASCWTYFTTIDILKFSTTQLYYSQYRTVNHFSTCKNPVDCSFKGPRVLGTFAKLQKVTVSFVMSVCMERNSHWMDFHRTWYFEYFSKKTVM